MVLPTMGWLPPHQLFKTMPYRQTASQSDLDNSSAKGFFSIDSRLHQAKANYSLFQRHPVTFIRPTDCACLMMLANWESLVIQRDYFSVFGDHNKILWNLGSLCQEFKPRLGVVKKDFLRTPHSNWPWWSIQSKPQETILGRATAGKTPFSSICHQLLESIGAFS